MPPRRATRAARSTPTRSLPSATRARSQGNTPGRTTALESTPLPDIEAEQSFAYGSSNTKLLPQQLVARKKMTIEQMAETLDAGIVEAERNFQAQREQANQYGITSADARAARAARRSSTRDSSVESDETPVAILPSRNRRVLANDDTPNLLQDIAEETRSQEEDEEAAREEDQTAEETRSQLAAELEEALTAEDAGSRADQSFETGSQPAHHRVTLSPTPATYVERSSFPPLIHYDHTYTQERAAGSPTAVQHPTNAWGKVLSFVAYVHDFLLLLWHRIRWCCGNFSIDRLMFYRYKALAVLTTAFIVSAIGLIMVSLLCDWYCETPWSLQPTLQWHHRVNGLCRYSLVARGNKIADPSPLTRASASKISRINKDIKRQEKLVQSMLAHQSVAAATIDKLTERQTELLEHQADLESKLSSVKAGQATALPKSPWLPNYLKPIFRRINYASIGVGAFIDPYLTSPTKTKDFALYTRLLLGSSGLRKYQSHPPIEALKPWGELGDCWCAASIRKATDSVDQPMNGKEGRYVQLGIQLNHDIFPDEVVIEHLPILTSPSPGAAPKDIELWGDFSHLDQLEFAALTNNAHPIEEIEWYPQLALLGRFRYDAPANEHGKYIQIFRLEYNQDNKDEYWTKKVALRIKSNWGGDNTCLYRVRVHGMPVHPHPERERETLRKEE